MLKKNTKKIWYLVIVGVLIKIIISFYIYSFYQDFKEDLKLDHYKLVSVSLKDGLLFEDIVLGEKKEVKINSMICKFFISSVECKCDFQYNLDIKIDSKKIVFIKNYFDKKANIETDNLNISFKNNKFMGIKANIKLDDFWKIENYQQVFIKEIDSFMKLKNVTLEFKYDDKLEINNAKADLSSGEILINRLNLIFGDVLEMSGNFIFDNAFLSDFIKKDSLVSINGKFKGEMDFSLIGDDFILNNLYIKNKNDGVIKCSPDNKYFNNYVEVIDINKILTNFIYSNFTITSDGKNNKLYFNINGYNPSSYNGKNFNINTYVSGNLNPIINLIMGD